MKLKTAPLERKYFDEYLDFLNDEDVARWLGGSKTADDVLKAISNDVEIAQSGALGTIVALEQNGSKIIGRAGIRPDDVDGIKGFELFYAILPQFRKLGLATQLSKVALEKFFENSDADRVITYTLPSNKASQAVMKKLGFEYIKDIIHADMKHVFFELTRERHLALASEELGR